MAKDSASNFDPKQDEGFTLVMSLIFISLISILVVGFLTSMRTEVFSSESQAQAHKAANFADAATDLALSKLRFATGAGSTPGLTLWASQPGTIVMATRNSTASTFGGFQTVTLNSTIGAYNDSADVSADLNQGSAHLVTAASDQLLVKWIYVLKDGTFTTSLPTYSATNNTTNPVGRFAYWVDDESTRINLNTAQTRTSSEILGAPLQANLKVFGNAMTDTVLGQLNTFRAGTGIGLHYFNTVREVLGAGTAVSSAFTGLLDSEKFSLTVNSQAPDLNMFGEPRIVLTTQQSLAGNAPFLDILANPNSDPGLWSNVDASQGPNNKVNNTVAKLVSILMRKDWPIVAGQSFSNKYNASSTASAVQIAVNIIDYVRSKESTMPVVAPLQGIVSGSTFTLSANAASIMGVSRAPKITERTCLMQAGSAPTKGTLVMLFEVCMPKTSNASVDLASLTLSYLVASTTSVATWTCSPTNTSSFSGSLKLDSTMITTFSSSPYSIVTVTLSDQILFTSPNTPTSVTTFSTFAANLSDGLCQLEYVPGAPTITVSSTLTSSNAATLQSDDPFVNKSAGDWVYAAGNFGTVSPTISPTICTLNTNVTVSGPLQDKGLTGLTDSGMQIPAVAGTTTNPYGVVESVAELGYVHTGVEPAPVAPIVRGTPWRTVRLQPKADTTTLPDWLLLDMFAAPKMRWNNPASKQNLVPTYLSYYVQPSAATATDSVNQRVGGVINVNSTFSPPFVTSSNALVTRTASLQAAFLGAYTQPISVMPSATYSGTATIAQNIANRVLATNGSLYGTSTALPLFSRGEIVELRGVTDTQELDENKLRGTIDLLTARSSVFRIYAVGQSIAQSAAGVTMLGEKRTMTLVERVSNSSGSKIQFNTISSGKPQ